MSGRKLTKNLALMHPDIKIPYMSGYTDDTVVRDGLLDQEVAFLQKPFTVEAIVRMEL